MSKPSLAETHPELAKQWHPTKNGELTSGDVTPGSNKKVWWKCEVADDHEWESTISNRSIGSGCACCRGLKVVLSNCLATMNPQLAKEWHPTKNGDLTPLHVVSGSAKKVWWKCDKVVDHEWQASINSRSSGHSCPCCRGMTVVPSNCLATLDPELASQWHSTKNGVLTPFDVTTGTNKKVWWKCEVADDHEWETSIVHRSNGLGCPCCSNKKVVLSNCLATTHPKLIKEWHPTKNIDLTPYDVTIGSNKKVWWKCDKEDDHEWEARISERSYGSGCPCCGGQKVVLSNCLKTKHPEIAQQWHSTKNGDLTPYDVTIGSNKKVWWNCDKERDHIWETKLNNRVKSGCPFCVGQKASISYNLVTVNSEIAKEWHPSKNGELTPFDVTAGTDKKVWWKCDKADDHEWEARICDRSKDPGCPCCSGKRVVLSNCLQTTHPKIAKTWHPTKNTKRTPLNVTFGSDKKCWWKCDNGDDHVWETKLNNRIRGDCPFCTLTPQSKQELIITFELKTIFKDINPKGYKTKIKGKIKAIDIFIPLLNLVIEFDGSYWHKDKLAIDKIKSELLIDEGYKVIRIREEPLKKIHENDIVSTHPYNGKEITDNILKRILETNDIFKIPMLNKMYEYLKKDSLQNEKGLDRYIDQILTEKAERSI